MHTRENVCAESACARNMQGKKHGRHLDTWNKSILCILVDWIICSHPLGIVELPTRVDNLLTLSSHRSIQPRPIHCHHNRICQPWHSTQIEFCTPWTTGMGVWFDLPVKRSPLAVLPQNNCAWRVFALWFTTMMNMSRMACSLWFTTVTAMAEHRSGSVCSPVSGATASPPGNTPRLWWRVDSQSVSARQQTQIEKGSQI